MFICLMNNGCIKTFENITTDVKKDIKTVLLTDVFIKNAMMFIDATFKMFDNKMPKIMIRIEKYIKPSLYDKLKYTYTEYRDEIIKILLMLYADINKEVADFISLYYKELHISTVPRQLTLDDLPELTSPIKNEKQNTDTIIQDVIVTDVKEEKDLEEEKTVKQTSKKRTPKTKKKSA